MLRSLNKVLSTRQTGISLLEVMLSLSIIAIILVMATRYFFVASSNADINKLRGQLSTVVSALQEYRNQNSDYSLATIPVLVTGGFIARTADVDSTGTNYNNPWGSPITVTGTASQATIATVVPTLQACNAIASGYSLEEQPSPNCAASGANFTFTLIRGL